MKMGEGESILAAKFKRQFGGYRREAVEACQAGLVAEYSRELEELRRELERERAETERLSAHLAAREAELRNAALRGTQSLRDALQSPYDSVQMLQDAMHRQVSKRQQLQAELERRRRQLDTVQRLHGQLIRTLQQTAVEYAEALAAEQAAWHDPAAQPWEGAQ